MQNNEHNIEMQEEEQESMVINPSENSVSSVNILNNQVLQVGFVSTMIYGPVLPPKMQWKRLFDLVLPVLLTKEVMKSVQISPFLSLFGKSSWNRLPLSVTQSTATEFFGVSS
jgi:hypothetical protein